MLIFLTSGKPYITSTLGRVVREVIALKNWFVTIGAFVLVANEAKREANINE